MTKKQATRDAQDRNYKLLAAGSTGIAFAVTMLYGVWIAPSSHKFSGAMAALLTAAAPFALGGLAGFLFGIPKTPQDNDPSGKPVASNGHRHAWQANTNLEQVSDWLTKILIGVGLTTLRQIPAQLQNTGEYIAATFGPDASPAVITAILITFAIAGFVIAYLLTKFDLSRAIDLQDGSLEALADAIVKNPNDRNAVESFMLSSLYLPPPDSYEGAIRAGESFLAQEGHPHPEDGDVFAYLACAYGEKYKLERERKPAPPSSDLEAIRNAVLANVRNAIARAPEWRSKLRQFANPPVGSKDDDLVALKDDPELRKLLEMT